MPYPREYYEFCEDSLTPVLNNETNEIVFIPLDNPIVQDVAVIPDITTVAVLNISNMSYSSITDHLNLPEPSKEATKDFIIDYIRNDYEPVYPLCLAGKPEPSKNSYELAYDQLTEKGLSVYEVLAQLKSTVQDWQEAYVADILVLLDIDGSGKSHAERLQAAIQAVKASPEYEYHGIINYCRPARFNVDSEDQIVYSLNHLPAA